MMELRIIIGRESRISRDYFEIISFSFKISDSFTYYAL
jgi:hypothetical protein